jgi:hypothetical protein
MSVGGRGLLRLGLLGCRHAHANAKEDGPAQKETDSNAGVPSHAKCDAVQSVWILILT